MQIPSRGNSHCFSVKTESRIYKIKKNDRDTYTMYVLYKQVLLKYIDILNQYTYM